MVDVLKKWGFYGKIFTPRAQRLKEHKGEERGGYCPRTMRELYDKITNKYPLIPPL